MHVRDLASDPNILHRAQWSRRGLGPCLRIKFNVDSSSQISANSFEPLLPRRHRKKRFLCARWIATFAVGRGSDRSWSSFIGSQFSRFHQRCWFALVACLRLTKLASISRCGSICDRVIGSSANLRATVRFLRQRVCQRPWLPEM